MSEIVRSEPQKEIDFSGFFHAEYERLLRALYLLTGNADEGEDLAQEAMVRVLERWDRVRRMASPTGYLFRTALNLHRSRLRRLLVLGRHLVAPTGGSDPADEVAARDELGRLLAMLPAGQREALILVEWVGMDPEAAGAILGIEPVSVRVRVSRARTQLRAARGVDIDE